MSNARRLIPLTVTTTAMPRPAILEQTFLSLRNRLLGCDLCCSQLLINIDPYPDRRADDERLHCLAIASRYFGSVQFRLPDYPNFALALKWLWQSTSSSFVFHLEDDWEFLDYVKLDEIFHHIYRANCDHLMLRAWTWRNYPFCLGPGVLRRRLYNFCAGTLTGAANPEAELRTALSKTTYSGLVFPAARNRVVLRDLGRSWMRSSGYVRGEGDFITWTKETPANRSAQDRLADQNLELLKGSGYPK